jgi:hypothetical protein
MNPSFVSAILLSISLAASGCSDPGSALKKPVYSASGTVKLFGAPIGGATVAFAPQDGQPTAFGTTDAQGNFTLTTYDFKDGAAVGKYKVVISKVATTAAKSVAGGADHEAEAEAVSAANSHDAEGAALASASLVPPQYGSAADSPLTAEVKSSGDNVFDFDLK